MAHNTFNTLDSFDLATGKGQFYSLRKLEQAGVGDVSKLPVSIRIVLESVLRNIDGKKITDDDVRALANWQPNGERVEEVPFMVARVLLQDFTGVPLLEYLARGVLEKDGIWYPDTLVGTDSHTTMINGLGIVGWGVGGIEAEAGMLGQPVYFLTPDVIGVHLSGALREGVTATDLVLTLTEMLRKAKVVGKFVEYFGEGTASLSLADRATIANMAPEYGATMGYFPVDEETCNYMRLTGRTDDQIAAFRDYFQAQGLFGMPKKGDLNYTTVLELDLATVKASVAGPKRPQDRIKITELKQAFINELQAAPPGGYGRPANEIEREVRTTIGSGINRAVAGGGEQARE